MYSVKCSWCKKTVLASTVEPGLGEDFERCPYCGHSSFLLRCELGIRGVLWVWDEVVA